MNFLDKKTIIFPTVEDGQATIYKTECAKKDGIVEIIDNLFNCTITPSLSIDDCKEVLSGLDEKEASFVVSVVNDFHYFFRKFCEHYTIPQFPFIKAELEFIYYSYKDFLVTWVGLNSDRFNKIEMAFLFGGEPA